MLQAQMKVWQAHNFPGREEWKPLLGVGEELGELNHAFLKLKQGIRGTPEQHRAKMKDAIGDLLIFLADFCNSQDLNMTDCMITTWCDVKKRDWIKYPLNGVSQ